MTTKKKLLSYNTIKHPLVAQFFDELEDTNLASHYVRQAIEFYQEHKNDGTLQTVGDNHSTYVRPASSSDSVEKENPPVSLPEQNSGGTKDSSEDGYSDFDPTSFK